MQLYGSYTSPFVRHCRIAVLEASSPCEFVETDHAASATTSPTKRVPFLQHGAIALHDSTSILQYLRHKQGQPFLSDPVELDRYLLVNTALDTTVNLFMLEKDGIKPEQSAYLTRQHDRIASTLQELNRLPLPEQAPYTDAELRLACYLDWSQYRNRVDIAPYPNLQRFLDAIKGYEAFALTSPPPL